MPKIKGYPMNPGKESMFKTDNVYFFDPDLTPTRRQQAYDDLQKFRKEFSAEINFEKDMIKYGGKPFDEP